MEPPIGNLSCFRLIPRGFFIAYTRADRRGFNMINVIKIVGEVASPKLIGK
jgi:hypothetical protein